MKNSINIEIIIYAKLEFSLIANSLNMGISEIQSYKKIDFKYYFAIYCFDIIGTPLS